MSKPPLKALFLSAFFAACGAAAFCADFLPPEDIPKEAVPVPMAVFNFDQDALGKLPERFTPAVTGEASGIQWEVERDPHAPSLPNVVVQNGTGKPGENFAILLLKEVVMDHGEMAVRFKALTDQEDQAAGLVYHYQDPQNYDVIVANVRDDTCALYRTKKGKRKLIGTQQSIITPLVWHELHITFGDGQYTGLIGKDLVLGGKDKPGQRPGLVGLWTSAGSQMAFDDFRVSKNPKP